jgi:hypothetical protein
MEWAVPCPPRFRSQVFSTSQRFLSKIELHGLVSCRNRSWAAPFRAFPPQGSWCPLGSTRLPRLSPDLLNVLLSALSPLVSPTRALLARSPGSPNDYGLPFHGLSSASWLPRTSSSVSLVRSASPASKPNSPCETVRTRPGEPGQRPLLSWVSSPPETSPSLGSSTHPRPERHAHEPFEHAQNARLRAHDRRDLWPPRPGETSPMPKHWVNLVGSIRSPSRPCRAAFRRRLLLPWPSAQRFPAAPDLRSFEVLGEVTALERSACLSWGSLPSRSPRDFEDSPVLAYRFASRLNTRHRMPEPLFGPRSSPT